MSRSHSTFSPRIVPVLVCALLALSALVATAEDPVLSVEDVADLVGLAPDSLRSGLADLAPAPEDAVLARALAADAGVVEAEAVTTAAGLAALLARALADPAAAIEPVRNGLGIRAPATTARRARSLLERLRRASWRFRGVRLAWLSCRTRLRERLERDGEAVPSNGPGERPGALCVSHEVAARLLSSTAEGADGRVLGSWLLRGRLGEWLEVAREVEVSYAGDLELCRLAGRLQALPMPSQTWHGLRSRVRALGRSGADAESWEVDAEPRRLLHLDRIETAWGAIEIPATASSRVRVRAEIPANRALLVPLPYDPFGTAPTGESRTRGEGARELLLLLEPLPSTDDERAVLGDGASAANAQEHPPSPVPEAFTPPETLELYDVSDLLAEVADYPPPRLGLPAMGQEAGPPPRAVRSPSTEDLLAVLRRLVGDRALFTELRAEKGTWIARAGAEGHAVLRRFLEDVRSGGNLLALLECRLLQCPSPIPEEVVRKLESAAPATGASGAQEPRAGPASPGTVDAAVATLGAGARLISAPMVSVFVGQRAHIFVGEQGAYVALFRAKAAAAAGAGAGSGIEEGPEPELRTWNAGASIGLRAVPAPDRRRLAIEVEILASSHTENRDFPFFVTTAGGERVRHALELPRMTRFRLTSTAIVQDGAWRVLAGHARPSRSEGGDGVDEPDLLLLSPRLTTLEQFNEAIREK